MTPTPSRAQSDVLTARQSPGLKDRDRCYPYYFFDRWDDDEQVQLLANITCDSTSREMHPFALRHGLDAWIVVDTP